MRLLGVLVFSACASLIFYEYLRSERARLKEYETLTSLLSHIEIEVAEGGRALGEALRSFCREKTEAEVPKHAILSADKEELGHSFPEADISDLELILALFSERAASSAKDEGERIRRVSDPIREKHGALKAGHSDKIKVALTLLCTSVAFAFFLLA